MMANALSAAPAVGLLTNGDDVLFMKLMPQPQPRYALSRTFSLYTLPEELEAVLRVLKRIGSVVA
jgi:hypothetical protein